MLPFASLLVEVISYAARDIVPTILGMLIRKNKPSFKEALKETLNSEVSISPDTGSVKEQTPNLGEDKK
jgi:hypothetical protein